MKLGSEREAMWRQRVKDLKVPADNLLGGEGNGFNMGQHRLAYGRLRHGMHNGAMAQRALDLAWASTQVELRELGVSPADAASGAAAADAQPRWVAAHSPSTRALRSTSATHSIAPSSALSETCLTIRSGTPSSWAT